MSKFLKIFNENLQINKYRSAKIDFLTFKDLIKIKEGYFLFILNLL